MKQKQNNKPNSDFEYELSELIESCEPITGHKKEVGEGALFNVQKQKMSIEEFKKTIEVFLKKGVK